MALTLVMRASGSNRLQNSCYGSGPIKPLVQISHPSPMYVCMNNVNVYYMYVCRYVYVCVCVCIHLMYMHVYIDVCA